MGVNADLFNFLVDLPATDNPDARKAFVTASGHRDLSIHLDWQGSNSEFFARLLDVFGRREQAALVQFLSDMEQTPQVTDERKPILTELRSRVAALDAEGWYKQFATGPSAAVWALRRSHLTLYPSEPATIFIPGGQFLMGNHDATAPAAERPQHSVTLPDFRIGKHPVTLCQYAAFIKDEKGHPAPKGWFNREPPAGCKPPDDRGNCPVTDVSWYDALAYCAWLEKKTGRPYTLPSEAEWEKACSNDLRRSAARETTEIVTANKYPWGDAWVDGRCNAGSTGTTPVMAHPAGASAYGVEDLLGNVQEWTRSLWGVQPDQPDYGYPYDPADGREVTDPAALPAQAWLVHRGGSYKSLPAELRCTARGSAPPISKIPWRGFRVALRIEESS